MVILLSFSFSFSLPPLVVAPCTTAELISEMISNSSPNRSPSTSFLISEAMLGVWSLIGVNRLNSSFLGVPGIMGEIFRGDTIEESGLEEIRSHIPVKSTRLVLLSCFESEPKISS